MMFFFGKFKYFDIPLLLTTILLSVVGLSMVYSTSISNENADVFSKQLLFFMVGFLVFIFFAFYDYHNLSKTNRIIYIVTVILLTGILFFGPTIRGGRRWLPLGFANIQLAEFAKITIILGLARILYIRRGQINTFSILLLTFIFCFIPAFLIFKEPDFGSGLVLISIWAGLLLISPIKKIILVSLFIFSICVGGVTWKFFLKDFQKDRILVFLSPELDLKGRGYNVRQAAIAIGSGQLWGRGLGNGLQSHNRFLPERQTDFIFAAGSEEMGFVGSFSIIILFGLLFYRLIKIVKKSKDDLGVYIVSGVFFLLFVHVAVNIGMNLGVLPVTGIPLPLISAGGSSILATFIALGIAQNVSIQSKVLRF